MTDRFQYMGWSSTKQYGLASRTGRSSFHTCSSGTASLWSSGEFSERVATSTSTSVFCTTHSHRHPPRHDAVAPDSSSSVTHTIALAPPTQRLLSTVLSDLVLHQTAWAPLTNTRMSAPTNSATTHSGLMPSSVSISSRTLLILIPARRCTGYPQSVHHCTSETSRHPAHPLADVAVHGQPLGSAVLQHVQAAACAVSHLPTDEARHCRSIRGPHVSRACSYERSHSLLAVT